MAEDSIERNIVIAMDGSHYSAFAFDWYIKNVHRKGDHVIIVHCHEPNTFFSGQARFLTFFVVHGVLKDGNNKGTPQYPADPYVLMALQQEEERKTKELMESLSGSLRDSGIGGKCKSGTGSPGNFIIKAAEEENATMIVTGNRGMGTLRRTFMGSTSDYIIHHSHVPVIVCRPKENLDQHMLPKDETTKL